MKRSAKSIRLPGRRKAWRAFALKCTACAALVSGCQSLDSSSSQPQLIQPSVVWKKSQDADTASSESVQTASAEEPAKEKGDPAKDVTPTPKPVPSPLPTPDKEDVIDLAAAFRLAGVANPTINLAREVTREALARLQGARVLLLPNLTVGGNYHQHQGSLQASPGFLRVVDSQSLYAGAGARTLAAESVAFPGVRLFSHLGDAIYEPLAARQNLEARRSMALATENQTLLQVAQTYFELVGAEVRLEALRKSEKELDDIVQRTAAYARRGQGRSADAHRAETQLSFVQRQVQDAEEKIAAASARLSGLLNLDPSTRLHSPGGEIEPVKLIDESEDASVLINRALSNRPEVRARLQEIAEARTRVKQEQTRPFLPLVSVGYSAGTFGGGSNLTQSGITQVGGGTVYSPRFGKFDGRSDFDVFAVWTLRNAGVGNRATVRGAQSITGQAIAELQRTRNEIQTEVMEALANAQAAARKVDLARKELTRAQEGYQEELTRIKKAVGYPLETLDTFRQLLDARQELVAAIIEYNIAQYHLFVAVGLSPLYVHDGPCP